MAKNGKNETLERIVLGTDRKNAQKLRRVFIKVLSKDKRSDGLQLSYSYHAFRKKADYTVVGHPKTVAKCLRAFGKFVAKEEKVARKLEMAREKRAKATPIATGKYYTMRSAKERTRKG